MGRVLNAAALLGAGFALTSFTAPQFSPAALDAADPTRRARSICGGPQARDALQRRLALASMAAVPASAPSGGFALHDDLAGPRLPITTRSETARRYFNQGLMLSYGFNHAGAVKSFREAQRHDPGCALCWWGEAAALGPNINAPMDDADRPAALAALRRAKALRGGASPLERALIDALDRRYSDDPAADRAALDAAYADAMFAAAARFPAENDLAVLAAEAAMDTTPWNYWDADKRGTIGRAGEAIRLVEAVIARNPDHPQANHLHIHLMENGPDPRRAEPAADRLAKPLAPSAGHLVHMPGHIYLTVGRYADAMRVNVAAARADEAFIRATDDRGLVRYGYYPHNIHFIVMAAQQAGDMTTAVAEARRLRTVLDPETSARLGWVQAIDAAPYLAMAQFAAPRDILAMPAADPRLAYANAMRHYARAVAYAQQRNRRGFARELAAMDRLAAGPAIADLAALGLPAADLVALARSVAQGRLAYAQGRYGAAIGHYRAAVAIEAKLPYQEPPFWYYPVSQSLGAALLRAGRPEEASQAFRAAIAQAPDSGWALYGLMRSETARGATLEAAAAKTALDRVWLGKRAWLDLARL